ncbi:uncharacterized protein [Amphiura filiformis]|uniref:uncharacterized protein n=1 Tax=Amphiura filiformis TaxID=82378 RepID=UPI003B2168BA
MEREGRDEEIRGRECEMEAVVYKATCTTSAISKLLHKILANRLEQFFLRNDIIDPEIQKGFLSGSNGLIEHIYSLNAIIDDAEQTKSKAYITFLDLANAFGSVPHEIIFQLLEFYRVPPAVISYIRKIYDNLEVSVKSTQWQTKPVPIKRGVFQGDTLSPIVFLIAFNPLLDAIKQHSEFGYRLTVPIPSSVGLPPCGAYLYLKCQQPRTGWYLVQVDQYNVNGSVDVTFKGEKQSTNINLQQTEWCLAWGSDRRYRSSNPPERPLPKVRCKLQESKTGKSSPHVCKSFADDLTLITADKCAHQKLLSKFHALASAMGLTPRPDKSYHLAINDNNASFSMNGDRVQSVKDKPTTFLGRITNHRQAISTASAGSKLLETIDSSLKSIDRKPIRGEYKTWIVLYYLIPSIRYFMTVHNIAKTNLEKSQAKINKHDALLREILPSLDTDATLIPAFILPGVNIIKNIDTQKPLKSCKKAISKTTTDTSVAKWNDKLQTLSVQSKCLEAVELESDNKLWRKIMTILPPGQLSFVLRASSDTLPTEVNLRRWKIQTSAVCCLCSQPNPTTFHVLNGCQEALQQGRFTWRHDCVLSSIVQFLKDNVQDGSTIYADIPGFQATSNPPSTVPPDISLTSARPDIVVINRNKNRVTLGELTVPHNSKQSMCNAKDRKANKPNYLTLIQELGEQFDNVQYVTIEVGSLGHTIQSDFHASLKYLCNANVSKQSLRVIMQDVCKTAITCSQSMFSRRKLSVWSSPPLSFFPWQVFLSGLQPSIIMCA